ncbi:hypothetical protein AB0G74_30165 [Streptomyces sp. NPDC020875]|uniref:hypothetical protein n=1 Tax=Streptomyces sp. NPDC020875 TaxID=3154898 RepID=UPI0033D0B073
MQLLRELTAGMGVRELAERYGGSKTLWGEYRSGVRLIPMTKLYGVVKDRVRDQRGREAMLAKARRLHEAAATAEAAGQPAPGVEGALRQAELDIDQMNRVISQLLSKIDALEQAAASAAPGAAASDEAAISVGLQLEELRSRVSAAREIQLATRQAYAEAQQGNWSAPDPVGEGEEKGSGEAGTGPRSEDLVEDLTRLHDQVALHQDALSVNENAAGAVQEPDALTSPPAVALPPASEDGDKEREGGHGHEGAGTQIEQRSLRVRLAAPGVLLGAAACLIGGIVIGLNHVSGDRESDRSLRMPPTAPSALPSSASPPGPPGLASHRPTPGTTPVPGKPTKVASPPARADAPVGKQPPGTLYTVSSDRKQVLQWTANRGWTTVGGIARQVFGGPAGIFATNPDTGNIYAREPSGDWRQIGNPGAQFLVNGASLYALTPPKDAVVRFNGVTWDNIGDGANGLFAGGAGLYATFPGKNNDLYRYSGSGREWTLAGGPGSEFAIGPNFIAGLAPNYSQVWLADAMGTGWHQISGPTTHIYAGGAGLFATSPTNNFLWKYTGTPHKWVAIGEAGSTHVVDDRSVYRIAKKGGTVERWTGGTTWTPLGKTASALDAH